MARIRFKNNIKTIVNVENNFTTDQIKHEPMIFSGSMKFAQENSGPITRKILGTLKSSKAFKKAYGQCLANSESLHCVIDTRVTMTFPGQYPSIPGWHCDDVPRPNKSEQPCFELCDDRVQHFMIILSDVPSVSCTEFVTENIEVEIDKEAVWDSLNREIEVLKPKTGFISPGDIVQFGQLVPHRASATKVAGWRYFFRASITYRKPVNEIRKQVQVYTPITGW
jgi:hypothetical protein